MGTDAFPVTDGLGNANTVAVDHDLTQPDGHSANTQTTKLMAGKAQEVKGLVGGRYVDGGSTSSDEVALYVDERRLVVQSPWMDIANSIASYTPDMAVGTTASVTAATRANSLTGSIVGVIIIDEAGSASVGGYSLLLFSSLPSAPTDHVLYTPSLADMKKLTGIVTAKGSNFTNLGGIPRVYGEPNKAGWGVDRIPFVLASGTTLYMIVVSADNLTFSGTSQLHVSFLIEQD